MEERNIEEKRTPPKTSVEEFGYKQELKRSLTFWDLLIYGIVFMIPVAPFGVYGVIFAESQGMVALAYLIGCIGMVFTALSYARMSEEFPISGSVYAFVGRGINQHIGFVAGWLILLDYILIPPLLYVGGALAIATMIPGVPAWLWIVVFIAFNTTINFFGVEITAKANKFFLFFQLIVLFLFVIFGINAIINGVNGASFSIDPLYNANAFDIDVVMGAVSIAVLSFLGFDALSTFSEESKGGKKAIGRATIFSLLIIASFFIIQTWVAALIIPDVSAFNNLDTAFYQVAQVAGGKWLSVLTAIAVAIAWAIADALVFQAAISRVLYSMARDRKLPKFLSKVHKKYKTPYASTFAVALLSLAISIPFMNDIGFAASLINFGALTSFLLLHVSVIFHFIYKNKNNSYWSYLILPTIGFLIIGYVWLNLDSTAKLIGLCWTIIGVFIAIVLAVKKKDTNLNL